MTVIHTQQGTLRAGNKPDWCQTPAGGYFRMPKQGGMHDCHYHDYNELYLVCSCVAYATGTVNRWAVDDFLVQKGLAQAERRPLR